MSWPSIEELRSDKFQTAAEIVLLIQMLPLKKYTKYNTICKSAFEIYEALLVSDFNSKSKNKYSPKKRVDELRSMKSLSDRLIRKFYVSDDARNAIFDEWNGQFKWSEQTQRGEKENTLRIEDYLITDILKRLSDTIDVTLKTPKSAGRRENYCKLNLAEVIASEYEKLTGLNPYKKLRSYKENKFKKFLSDIFSLSPSGISSANEHNYYLNKIRKNNRR